ncbi:MAG: hypothetical protein JRN11_07860 [Nitrososphaerota archaeon]|jgi:hypothetical protein|nr:hypothetical protein [Nitrososphaerota archaeon]MDG6951549.1 hypothetical protein [Nitrososphaerota archaeon]MDG6991054.1 hypothetical protein [Nitrososphaerota archaeon]MDG7016518.1 hypothetical protein [Nitrososphaerota archaeon]MDG7026647.1 hypothetical protein [Nitrososphaerota archaeon]
MPKGRPFPSSVAKYFAGEIPFSHLNRKEREFVRRYERDRKRRHRARRKRLLKLKNTAS